MRVPLLMPTAQQCFTYGSDDKLTTKCVGSLLDDSDTEIRTLSKLPDNPLKSPMSRIMAFSDNEIVYD